jgi:hypothetical protein
MQNATILDRGNNNNHYKKHTKELSTSLFW